MTEPQNDVTAAQEETPAPAPAKPARKVNRKAVALIAGGVAAAVLVGGGIWASSAVADADREAPTAYWVPLGEQLATREAPGSVPANALLGKLLPIPAGFVPGPDLEEDGNDFFVSGEKAVEGFKETRSGLTSAQRKDRDKMLANLKLKGLAGRSYVNERTSWFAEIRIMQADPKAVGAFSEVSKKFLDFQGDGRQAPKVDGFPDAKCSLEAIGEKKKEKIDSLDCVAVEGDVMVTFRAYGPKPFATAAAVALFQNQMNHLKSPGESA
ncbi:hypothetical protein [Streptomyces sp. NBC_01244]|uniref:hypothetical protein n=1 Tax=Streptomyces sp. NBC_01244 TaxID=2903797 RepID=UPI002E1621CF|nr:hypothetical protein OG247_20115 [Streptomyces sp. NBC_01244]